MTLANPMVPQISVCIVTHAARQQDVERALESVFKYASDMSIEVILVDNGSTNQWPATLTERFPFVIVIQNKENMGYAPAMNLALRRSTARYVSCLSDDAEFLPGSVQVLFSFMEAHPKCGLCGPQVLNADGEMLSTRHHPNMLLSVWGEIVPIKSWLRRNKPLRKLLTFLLPNSSGLTSDYGRTAKVRTLCGTPILVRREFLNDVGLLDGNMPLGPDDYDWCYRAHQKGYEIWFVAESTMIHRQKPKEDPSRLRPINLFVQLPALLYYYQKNHNGLKLRLFRMSVLLLSLKWRWKIRRKHGTESLHYKAVEAGHRICLDTKQYLPEIVGNWTKQYRLFEGSK
jgi:GT2 family glycosyltransferase